MKTIETKIPFFKSVSHCARLRVLAFAIFLAALAYLVPTVLAQSTCESYTFTTLAGDAGYGSADGAGSDARFWGPYGVAVDSAGNVYVADSGNHAIRKVTPAGVVTTLAGRAGNAGSADGTGSDARFNKPSSVAVDSAGNVYVAESGNNTIRKVTPAGLVTTLTGVAGSYGTRLAVDSAGNIYVADSGNNTIRKVTPAGVTTTLAGLAGSSGNADGTGSDARFREPVSVAVDSAGNVYVADYGNQTIRKVTPAGVVTTLAGLAGSSGSADGTGSAARFGTRQGGPYGVAVDSAGNVYVADIYNQTIRKVTPAGVVTTLAGLAQFASNGAAVAGSADGTGSAARFNLPSGVAVDSAGNIYVADTFNNTIRKVTPTAMVTTLAGLAAGAGSADGTGSDARFNGPSGVAVDGAGNAYVADYENQTIRKVTPAGAVTTLAGLAGRSGSTDRTGSAARFNGPRGVAADTSGNVYVADSGNHTIRKVTSAGVVTTLAGLAGSTGSADGTGTTARFSGPFGVAVDSAGNLYVADGRIRKVTPAGVVTTLAALGGSAVAVAVDPAGNLYLLYSNAIEKATLVGTNWMMTTLTGMTGGSALAVDGAGNVFAVDRDHNAIRKVTPAGEVTALAGVEQLDDNGNRVYGNGSADGTGSDARFYGPSGVTVDSAGNVYVADSFNATIRKGYPIARIQSACERYTFTTLAGNAGYGSADGTGSDARFWYPYGMAMDSAGNVFVADSENHTIRKVSPAGVVTTLAGLAGIIGSADGMRSAARFNHPTGVAVDSAGSVYVADSNNHTIRKVTPTGEVTTLAGHPSLYDDSGNLVESFSGSADGTGSAALFSYPTGVAVDSAGNVYVAENVDNTIRKVTPAGVVTTLAGLAQLNQSGQPVYGSEDGTGNAARFNRPSGVAVDGVANIYVADSSNNTIRKVTPTGVVTTLAGLAGSGGSADGTGSAARFGSPYGVAVDSAGNVYVADRSNTIRKVTPAGVVTTLAGVDSMGSADGTGSEARFNQPSGVTVDNAGNVYVADTYNHTIRKVTPAGVVTTLAGLAGGFGSVDGTGIAAQFSCPSGVAVDNAGNVYVADRNNNTIRKVTQSGVVTTLAGLATNGSPALGSADGTGSDAQFSYPGGVAVDSAGIVYVADTGNSTIRKLKPGGVVTTVAGLAGTGGSADGTGSEARFNQPLAVAVDTRGNIYVADTHNDTIRKVTPAGVVTTLAGLAGIGGSADGTGSDARFASPSGVAVDSAGNVYVADTGNNTIRKMTSAGVVTTLAGRAPDQEGNSNSGSADGTGSDARFYGSSGVAVDSAGNVYVADSFNAMIRKVTPSGVVTTLAGLAGVRGNADGAGSAARFGKSGGLDFFAPLSGPAGVAVDSEGNLYVADTVNNTIRKGYPENVPAVIVTFTPGFGFNGGQFGFNLTGPAGQLVVVEASSELVSWLPIWTNTFAGTLNFSDPQIGVYSNRFYRAHLP